MKSRYVFFKKVLLFWLAILLSSGLFGQTGLLTPVSLKADKMPLEKALQKLEQQTEFRFSYSRDLIPQGKKVTCEFEQEELKTVLESILDGTGIQFKKTGSQIILIPLKTPINEKTLLHGFIRDQTSGEALIGAVVYDKRSGIGAYTNKYGFYSLELPPDSLEILVQYMGYDNTTTLMAGGGPHKMDQELKLSDLALEAVEIMADDFAGLERETQMSQFRISPMELKKIPALAGEVDILRSLQMLPGVRGGYEGTAGLYVRGGGPDQNLILIDDVPVYNVSHLFGFFSVFNSDAIRSVELTKGGFPARYGGRLSSVLDIRMKEGNLNKFGLDASIGLISAQMTAEGPIKKGKSSFMISGRRTYLDALAVPFQKIIRKANDDTGHLVGYRFWDLNAKVNHIFSDKDRLYLSVYSGRDREHHSTRYTDQRNPETNYIEQSGGLAWHNLISSLRWNHQFSDRMFVNTALIFSDYQFSVSDKVTIADSLPYNSGSSSINYLSRIQDIGVKTDFDYHPGRNHTFHWGAAFTRHNFRPGANRDETSGALGNTQQYYEAPRIPAPEGYLYIEDEIRFHPRISANLGAHASSFWVKGENYKSLQPRLSGRFQVTEKTALKASFVTMSQNLHLLTNSGIGLPTDLWVPPTDKVLPQQSWQVAAGLGGRLGEQFEWSIEGYLKETENIIAYQNGALLINTSENWEDNITAGSGTSKGLEFFIRKKTGKLTGWLGYTLSKTQDQFDELNGGKPFPNKYDRPHDFSLVTNYQLNKKVNLSLNWVFSSGRPATLPVAIAGYGFNGYGDFRNTEVVYGERNNYRMRPFHRLDLGISLYKKKKWGERWWTFGLYNAYNRLNPSFINAREVSGPTKDWELYEFSFLPVIPSFSYRIKI